MPCEDPGSSSAEIASHIYRQVEEASDLAALHGQFSATKLLNEAMAQLTHAGVKKDGGGRGFFDAFNYPNEADAHQIRNLIGLAKQEAHRLIPGSKAEDLAACAEHDAFWLSGIPGYAMLYGTSNMDAFLCACAALSPNFMDKEHKKPKRKGEDCRLKSRSFI